MEKTKKVNESSVMYRKIDELRMSALDRAEAIAALEAADNLSDAIYWVFEKFERIGNWLTPAPKLKHL